MRALTTAHFRAYKAIVFGDPNCIFAPPPIIAETKSAWAPAIDGHILIYGTPTPREQCVPHAGGLVQYGAPD